MLKRGKRAMHAALLRAHGVLIRASAPRDSSWGWRENSCRISRSAIDPVSADA
jgi:hypothetical protein